MGATDQQTTQVCCCRCRMSLSACVGCICRCPLYLLSCIFTRYRDSLAPDLNQGHSCVTMCSLVMLMLLRLVLLLPLGALYFFHVPVSRNSISYLAFVGDISLYFWAMLMIHGIAGLYPIGRRRVRSTRLYWYSLPVAMLFAALVCWPLWATSCHCNNYKQCQIIESFARPEFVNEFFSPTSTYVRPAPPKADGVTCTNTAMLAAAAGSGNVSSHAGTGTAARLSAANEADDIVKALLQKRCSELGITSCGGLQFSGGSERRSCYAEPGKSASHNWCFIEGRGEPSCDPNNAPRYTCRDGQRDLVWAEDICAGQDMCSCSGFAMSPGAGEESLFPDKPFGKDCRKWLAGDSRSWCFVGYDSVCPDKEAHKLEPLANMTNILEVFQWKSSIPCESHVEAREGAVTLCWIWVTGCGMLWLLQMVVLLILSVLIYFFLQNHCGDSIQVTEQFEVDHDASSSDEEWAATRVKTNVSSVELTEMKKGKGGAASREV